MNPCTKVIPAGDSINFVDTNNVVVGFYNEQSCCENFGHYVSPTLFDGSCSLDPETTLFEGWVFDPGFCFNKPDACTFLETSEDKYDQGAAVAFRLVRADGSEGYLYLHLFNSHNGFYSHGFSVDVGGMRVTDGSL
jgi:hypothetical protein